jgi:hypothetical protein
MYKTNIKDGHFIITLKETGNSISFQSATSITDNDPRELKGIKPMQGGKGIKYMTGNQEMSSTEVELSPITKEEHQFLLDIWNNTKEFDAVFSHIDGYINYINPGIQNKPMLSTIGEDEVGKAVLKLICDDIEYN